MNVDLMEFFRILIEFILKLFFTFFSIEIVEGVSFGLLFVSFLVIYLFIKFFMIIGGGKDDYF